MRNLFTTWYECGNAERQKELDHCIKANIDSGLFDNVYILVSCQGDHVEKCPFDAKRIIISPHSGKEPYGGFFLCSNVRTKENDINIIANTDIIFDETILLADNMQPDECYALSRWEMDSFTEKYMAQIQVYGDSQDVWIFKGKIKPMEFTDFPLGKMGCDNRIAYEIHKAGYKISNPSKSIKTWHLHKSNLRNYNPAIRNADTVVDPPYLNVPVVAL